MLERAPETSRYLVAKFLGITGKVLVLCGWKKKLTWKLTTFTVGVRTINYKVKGSRTPTYIAEEGREGCYLCLSIYKGLSK